MQRVGINRTEQNQVRRWFMAGVSLERISAALDFPVAKLKNTVKGLVAPVVQDGTVDVANLSKDIRAELIADMVKLGIIDKNAGAALNGQPVDEGAPIVNIDIDETDGFIEEDEHIPLGTSDDDDLPDALKGPLEDVVVEIQDRN